jgi:hypothetical protein
MPAKLDDGFPYANASLAPAKHKAENGKRNSSKRNNVSPLPKSVTPREVHDEN